mmetsp:Transcript_14190/g.40792  ORF Transcript_14190/g.40792 Transcript_14190/m.40792 type:complete len:392 (-) Transcript_14190:774-1949(-)
MKRGTLHGGRAGPSRGRRMLLAAALFLGDMVREMILEGLLLAALARLVVEGLLVASGGRVVRHGGLHLLGGRRPHASAAAAARDPAHAVGLRLMHYVARGVRDTIGLRSSAAQNLRRAVGLRRMHHVARGLRSTVGLRCVHFAAGALRRAVGLRHEHHIARHLRHAAGPRLLHLATRALLHALLHAVGPWRVHAVARRLYHAVGPRHAALCHAFSLRNLHLDARRLCHAVGLRCLHLEDALRPLILSLCGVAGEKPLEVAHRFFPGRRRLWRAREQLHALLLLLLLGRRFWEQLHALLILLAALARVARKEVFEATLLMLRNSLQVRDCVRGRQLLLPLRCRLRRPGWQGLRLARPLQCGLLRDPAAKRGQVLDVEFVGRVSLVLPPLIPR